jgi:hypothetical protein
MLKKLFNYAGEHFIAALASLVLAVKQELHNRIAALEAEFATKSLQLESELSNVRRQAAEERAELTRRINEVERYASIIDASKHGPRVGRVIDYKVGQ